ncbi:hypothetical protein Syun_027283 [Stephania yunnanensis]|uniref:Uncharacterized protein n=1 Tax=Stephania yunnanensis TaxID=152371 RepID=A0AAP0EKE9_9MAGN
MVGYKTQASTSAFASSATSLRRPSQEHLRRSQQARLRHSPQEQKPTSLRRPLLGPVSTSHHLYYSHVARLISSLTLSRSHAARLISPSQSLSRSHHLNLSSQSLSRRGLTISSHAAVSPSVPSRRLHRLPLPPEQSVAATNSLSRSPLPAALAGPTIGSALLSGSRVSLAGAPRAAPLCGPLSSSPALAVSNDARKKEFDDINAEMLKLKIDLNPTTSGQASNDVEVEDVGDEDDEVESLETESRRVEGCGIVWDELKNYT